MVDEYEDKRELTVSLNNLKKLMKEKKKKRERYPTRSNLFTMETSLRWLMNIWLSIVKQG